MPDTSGISFRDVQYLVIMLALVFMFLDAAYPDRRE